MIFECSNRHHFYCAISPIFSLTIPSCNYQVDLYCVVLFNLFTSIYFLQKKCKKQAVRKRPGTIHNQNTKSQRNTLFLLPDFPELIDVFQHHFFAFFIEYGH